MAQTLQFRIDAKTFLDHGLELPRGAILDKITADPDIPGQLLVTMTDPFRAARVNDFMSAMQYSVMRMGHSDRPYCVIFGIKETDIGRIPFKAYGWYKCKGADIGIERSN